jgi:cellulose synthase/poly-beta-1,6-N-acetylglucosamine synthase-like glycosyltransferase
MLFRVMSRIAHKALTLSIVIPVYNEENYLKNCLDSIAKQSVKPLQVIVVDNNSKDKSVSIAKSYPFVTVVREKRQGIAHARDAGFNAVKADLIGRIDADTQLPATWVEDVLEAFKTRPEMAFTGSGYFYDMPMKRAMRIVHIFYYFWLNRLICGQYLLWGSNMAFPSKYWPTVRDVVSPDNSIAEDMDLSFALHPHCPVVFMPEIKTSNSFRSGQAGLVAAWKYVRRWPKSLAPYNRLSAVLAWLIIASMVILFGIPVLLLHLASKLKKLLS